MISEPDTKPRFPHEDRRPDMTQTRSPFLYGRVVPGSGACSFHFPANEHTATPPSIRRRETLVTTIRNGEKSWEGRKIKGITVPAKAARPAIMANPTDIPTEVTPSPNVTALTPQPSPKRLTTSNIPGL